MMITRYSPIALFAAALVIEYPAQAQTYNTNYGSQSRTRSRIATPYFAPQAYGYGASSAGRAAAYSNPYQFSPYMGVTATQPKLPPVSGPIERYSEVEYGKIVQMAIQAARENSPSPDTEAPRPSIVQVTTGTETGAEPSYRPVSTSVSDVLDRAILLLPTGEELRLRGVTSPSTTDTNDVSRLYAKEAIRALRNLVQGKEVYVVLDEPLRDGSGRLLGTVFLADGTELNRRMLELGYGTLKTEDFATAVDYSDLSVAQQSARSGRTGIWSGGY